MPACASETVAPLRPSTPSRVASCCSLASSSTSTSSGFSTRPGSPAEWAPCPEPESLLSRILGWYPALLIRILHQMIFTALLLLWSRVLLSSCLWLLERVLRPPLTMARWFLGPRRTSGRTVLVTGGDIETLQVARNLQQCGARVVVAECEGQLGLTRFSTAVTRLYQVPDPKVMPHEYVRELKRVAERENASYFLPASSSNPAHFDAMVRPQLEALGVTCACPTVREAAMLDDPACFLQICREASLQTPPFIRVCSLEQLVALYEEGRLRRHKHILTLSGPVAARETPCELELPQTRRGFRRLVQITPQPRVLASLSTFRPGLVLQLPEGERLVVCATLREGRVVASVTCRLGELSPLQRPAVNAWLARLPPKLTSFSGHVTFSLVFCSSTASVVPLQARTGLSRPYLCYDFHQPRAIMRPCKHHPEYPSPSSLLGNNRYWLHEVISQAIKHPGLGSAITIVTTLLYCQEALLLLRDPLPALIYYGFQLPARALYRYLHPSPRLKITPILSRDKLLVNNNMNSIDSPSPLSPEDCVSAAAVYPNHKNGWTRKNGCTHNGFSPLNGHASVQSASNEDLIQL